MDTSMLQPLKSLKLCQLPRLFQFPL